MTDTNTQAERRQGLLELKDAFDQHILDEERRAGRMLVILERHSTILEQIVKDRDEEKALRHEVKETKAAVAELTAYVEQLKLDRQQLCEKLYAFDGRLDVLERDGSATKSFWSTTSKATKIVSGVILAAAGFIAWVQSTFHFIK